MAGSDKAVESKGEEPTPRQEKLPAAEAAEGSSDAPHTGSSPNTGSTPRLSPPRTFTIANPLRVGYMLGLGLLLAFLTGIMVQQGSTILVYVGLALFLALGADPVVSWFERTVPRWAAVTIVFGMIILIFAALIFAIVPMVITQVIYLSNNFAQIVNGALNSSVVIWLQSTLSTAFDLNSLANQAITFAKDPQNLLNVGGGVLAVGVGFASALSGTIIVLILSLYFMISLPSIKHVFVRFFPAYRRDSIAVVTDDIYRAVGRYVMGQVTLAAINGILSFIFLSIIGAPLPSLLAFLSFLFSLLPLVGTLMGSAINVLVCLFASPLTAIAAAIYYLIYMQVEAYILSPRIMNRAVSIPGALVVIAAAAGAALGGVLGALVAIPIAASVLIIIQRVIFPAQDSKNEPNTP